ncbi:hypothetical protein, partial [Escherichia coli]|uniref:hypothetical protein n=1 Tax=Escherichia coli TaxID=562 RepID=UPI001BE4BB63
MSILTAPSCIEHRSEALPLAQESRAFDAVGSDGASARLSIHDTTSLEWSVRLPISREQPLSYR